MFLASEIILCNVPFKGGFGNATHQGYPPKDKRVKIGQEDFMVSDALTMK
jgi:hypothetical protein